MTTVLILMGDRLLSRILFSCFWILFHAQHDSCWFEEKLNHPLKIDADKLFKDLLTQKYLLSKFYLGILR